MAEQEPVEKENIVELHAIEHDKIPRKEPEIAEAVPDSVPRGEDGGAEKQQNRDPLDRPADDMRPAEPRLPVGDRVQIFLRRGRENPLVLNQSDCAI